mgnify:FL=1
MSLISIAQRETFHISFVQFANKGYGVDLLTPRSYKVKKEPLRVLHSRNGPEFPIIKVPWIKSPADAGSADC